MTTKTWEETMKGCKLTDLNGQTHGGMQWGENVTHRAEGDGTAFCSPDLIHFYSDPLLAVLHNPIHANFKKFLLWEVEAEEPVYNDHGLKYGAKAVTTIKVIPTPDIPLDAKVRYGILCGKVAYQESSWNEWADNWLSGKDRSFPAAYAADASAAYAASSAAYAAYAAYAYASDAYASVASDAYASDASAAVAAVASVASVASVAAKFKLVTLATLAYQAVREEAEYVKANDRRPV